MGVAVFSYNEILVGKSIFSRISRWSFKSDFTHILFSQDGGDIERFKKRYLYDNVSYSTLFNGVKKKKNKINFFKKIDKKYSRKIKILFVSRLESNKNCDLLIKSIMSLDDKIKKNCSSYCRNWLRIG